MWVKNILNVLHSKDAINSDFFLKTTFSQVSIHNQLLVKILERSDKGKTTFKAIEKYRYGLWKTVSKHLKREAWGNSEMAGHLIKGSISRNVLWLDRLIRSLKGAKRGGTHTSQEGPQDVSPFCFSFLLVSVPRMISPLLLQRTCPLSGLYPL